MDNIHISQDKQQQPAIPPEWQTMSLEELRILAAEKESELDSCRKSRNKYQVEHASLQEYYNVTQEQIRELDMKIDKIDLDIQNTEEDNITELKVYKQKAKFIQYCHENKIKAAAEDDNTKQQLYNAYQEKRLSELGESKGEMMAELNQIEQRHAGEIQDLQTNIDQELVQIRQNLDSEVDCFQQDCKKQLAQLKEELEAKHKAEVEIVTSRKESHVQDLMQSHETACQEMSKYFDDIERQQEIEMEELQMEIRRLKKAAIHHDETKERLEKSNADFGKELDVCMQQVSTYYFFMYISLHTISPSCIDLRLPI